MLGLIFVRVIWSNLWVICSPKHCAVFLETRCAAWVNICTCPAGLHPAPHWGWWHLREVLAGRMFLAVDVAVWCWGWALPTLLCRGDRQQGQRASRLVFREPWNCSWCLQHHSFAPCSFFLSSESFCLWIYLRKSNKLSILSAYITHKCKWWLCIYIVQKTFIHFNIALILNYMKVCSPFSQELCLSLK